MSKHTQEPWPHFIEWCEPATPHPDSDGFVGLGFEDYRRARACVNACRGLPTDELEQKGLVAAVGTQLLEADQLRDELLASLEALFHESSQQNLRKANDVIAKAKGGAA